MTNLLLLTSVTLVIILIVAPSNLNVQASHIHIPSKTTETPSKIIHISPSSGATHASGNAGPTTILKNPSPHPLINPGCDAAVGYDCFGNKLATPTTTPMPQPSSPITPPTGPTQKCFLPAIEDPNGKCFIPPSTPPVSPTACKETGSCFSPVGNSSSYKTIPLTHLGIVGGLIK
jgi:hypothetical protein